MNLLSENSKSVPALQVDNLTKSFGPVSALRGVSLSVMPGEVVGLLGDNGAGKSTFVKCVTGRLKPDTGSVKINGDEVHFRSVHAARKLGVEVVHQNLALANSLDASSNLFLGREIVVGPHWLGLLNKREMRRQTADVLQRLHVNLKSPRVSVEDLSGGQRQGIAVGRAVAWGQRVVLMDEPAAALGVEQSQHVLDLVRRLGESGVAVLFISHNMQHVMEVCHRVTVLQRGMSLGSAEIADVTAQDLVGFITGAQPMATTYTGRG